MELETTRPPPQLASAPPFMPSSLASAVSGLARGGGEEFTADDLEAADQLVQLSVSGGGDEEDQCCSSSARSVNNAEQDEGARDDEDDDDDAAGRRGMVDRRARKRYRLLSELYAATRQVKLKAAGGGAMRRKGRDGVVN